MRTYSRKLSFLCLLGILCLLVCGSQRVRAQEVSDDSNISSGVEEYDNEEHADEEGVFPSLPGAEEKSRQPSYGKEPLSIMYSDDEMEKLRTVLNAYELEGKVPEDPETAEKGDFLDELTQDVEPDVQAAEQALPVFYLGSIVYRGPEEWSVWVNGERISNVENIQSLRVNTISRERAEFMWKLENVAQGEAIRRSMEANKNTAVTDHREAEEEDYDLNVEEGVLRFSLRPNQTFLVKEMKIIEGRLAPVNPTNLAVVPASFPEGDIFDKTDPLLDGQDQDGNTTDSTDLTQEEKIVRDLVEQIMKMQALVRGGQQMDGQ